ncbi:hypothetical protein GCM10017044_13800 [Kordiimonas sediminis]|uniref:DUF1192 domain-containing protein n=1 Tax=Kordiimonas sediminis TaxID=1735581 RepID=A0A919E780_9PROT|nr:DUF1192 domain-containing protein [Kordiimonas sediminis]GHF20235.1 hypothetical protein GCM10017044_13800 [Kordiimonas sediminis]
MDDDDLPMRKDSPLSAVEKEDLYDYSVAELEDRIHRLECEIARTKADMAGKSNSMAAAEALFKS